MNLAATRIAAARIAARVVRQGECLVWTGATNGRGYGQIRVGEKLAYVHRVVWEARLGVIPEDITVDHTCRTKLCTLVEHMELVTRSENGLRASPVQATCRKGHSLDDAYVAGQRRRVCRTCHLERKREYYRRNRSAMVQDLCNLRDELRS